MPIHTPDYAVLYDCDGTLIDSEHIAGSVCADALTKIGYPIDMATFNARFTGSPVARTWEILRAEIPFALPEGFNAAIDAEIHRRFKEELQGIEGVEAAICALSPKRAVASSTHLPVLRANLIKVGLAPLFGPHIYSASQVARGKPAPDVFLFAASQVGADPSECIVVEDSVTGVTAAMRAGMRVVGFCGASNGVPDLPRKLQEAGALGVVEHMHALPGVIETLVRAPKAG